MVIDHRVVVTQQAEVVEVRWADGIVSTLPNLWLRDNCNCDQCKIPQTSEKKFFLADVPSDLRPAAVDFIDDELRITWPDGHLSSYASADLQGRDTEGVANWTPWAADFEPRRTDYQAFLDDDAVAADTMADFLDYGACVFQGAPVLPGTLEELAPRLGPVREVLFERIHNVEVYEDGYNVAHTSLAVPPHNDFASYSWPPSVQALHMLVNDTPGGESVIVDGWHMLQQLSQESPDLFESLCTMPVPFREFDADNETYTVAPMISRDAAGNVTAFRFSNQLMQAIDPTQPGVGLFYRAYHELCSRVTQSDLQATFRLNAGEILLVASHRVLHARKEFTPTAGRHLQDAYYELDNVRNNLRILQRKSGS